MPVVVAEDDVIIRTAQVILDPATSAERRAAIADYYHVDMPEFDPWVDGLRASCGDLYPARFLMVRDQEALRGAIADADAVICQELTIGTTEFAAAKQLRIVQKFGVDLRNINLPAAAARAVIVKPLRRRVNIAVAEHAIALMLSMAKKLFLIDGRIDEDSLREAGFSPRMYDRRHIAAANWARVPGLRTLHGATVGCLGLGEIGREVAQRVHAFGANVLYYQRHRLPSETEARFGATYCGLEDILERSDFISIHLPLNDSTRGMINAEAFGRMKDGAFIVNISRAPIIDRDALIEALKEDRLGGVALDVHYQEPAPPDEPLKSYKKVVLTPHTAVASRHGAAMDMEELVSNLAEAINRGP